MLQEISQCNFELRTEQLKETLQLEVMDIFVCFKNVYNFFSVFSGRL